MTSEQDYYDLIIELKHKLKRVTLKYEILKIRFDAQQKVNSEMFSNMWKNRYE